MKKRVDALGAGTVLLKVSVPGKSYSGSWLKRRRRVETWGSEADVICVLCSEVVSLRGLMLYDGL